MFDDTTQTATKGGEEIVRVRLQRSIKNGCLLTIWAHPLIENFFKEFSDGAEPQNVSQFGNNWRRAKGQPPLLFYPAGLLNTSTTNGYSLTGVGDELYQSERASGMRGGLVNMAMLRLVGVSDGVGVSFYFNHVGSSESLEKLASQLTNGAKAFYVEHLKPFDMSVSIVAQKM